MLFSYLLLHTDRVPASPPPPGWEQGEAMSDGLRLRTWMRRGSGDRAAAVIAHGLGDSLESFVDYAERLHARGHTVLLLDLRAHGGSEGRYTTLGGLERNDVRAAMALLREQGLGRNGFVLVGFSMGAVAAIGAAADEPSVRAVVAEAPFDTYRETVALHARLLYGIPRWLPIADWAIRAAERRAHFHADDIDCVAAARRIRAPLYLVADGADRRMPAEVVHRIFDAHAGPKEFWIAPGAPHVGASDHPEYWPRLLRFLERNGL